MNGARRYTVAGYTAVWLVAAVPAGAATLIAHRAIGARATS